MNLVIDEGNTRIKLAVFKKSELVDIEYSSVSDFSDDVNSLLKKYLIEGIIISSVTDEVSLIFTNIDVDNKYMLSHLTPLPFTINYKTPQTLGVDRIALVAAAWERCPNKASLIIDAGTCITYDYIDKKGVYYGGAISPGLNMRFDSMHHFTKKLPSFGIPSDKVLVLGQNTQQSMESGVVNGVVFEISGMIESYKLKDDKINVMLTGGDASFLEKQLKNEIFVNPNFLLEGLNKILNFQSEN